jgi:hypothetical protein
LCRKDAAFVEWLSVGGDGVWTEFPFVFAGCLADARLRSLGESWCASV